MEVSISGTSRNHQIENDWQIINGNKHKYNSSTIMAVQPQNGMTITWYKAATDKASGRKLDITWTITDIATVPNNSPQSVYNEWAHKQEAHGWPLTGDEKFNATVDTQKYSYFEIYSNPIDEVGFNNIAGFKARETLSYSDDGSLYTGIYYRTAGSLNAQWPQDRWEFASPVSGVKGSYIANDSLILPNEQQVAGIASMVVKNAFMIGSNHEHGPGLGGAYGDLTPEALTKEGVTFLVQNNSVIAYGISGKPGSGKNAQWDIAPGGTSSIVPSYYEHLMGTSQTTAPLFTKKTTAVHYHYDTKSVKILMPEVLIYGHFRHYLHVL